MIAALCAMGLLSCEEPTSHELPGPDSLFSIDRLEIDTLYWGETAKLLGSSFGTDPKRIKIFRGTTELNVIQVSDEFLYFGVGEATSGELRVYKDDHLAKGSVSITIIPHADGMPLRLEGLAPTSGDAGDQFVVLGENLDVRRRDILVRLGKEKLVIDSMSKYAIYCRVPLNARTDEVTVVYDHRVRTVGSFIVAPAITGDLSTYGMETFTLRLVMPVMLSLSHGNGEGMIIDTTWLDDSLAIPITTGIDRIAGIKVSSRYTSTQDTIDIIIDLDKVGSKYSGTITIDAVRPAYTDVRYHRMVFKLEGATLRTTMDGIGFYCAAPLDPNEIRLLEYDDIVQSPGNSQMRYEMIEPWEFIAQGEGIPIIRMEFK
jgi:hypothetical protein